MPTYGNPYPCGCSAVSRMGRNTLSVYVGLTGGASAAVESTEGCTAIPRKSGGSLNLSRLQLAGQDIASSAMGPDGWTPAGAAGAFAFMPFLGNPDAALGNPYIIQTGQAAYSYTLEGTIGTVTYYSSDSPRPVSARVDTSTYFFTDSNSETGATDVYGAYGNKNHLAGRLLKRVDRNNNTVYYKYSASGSAPSTYLLRKLTGDISGITPYFMYSSEGLPAPITKIFLSDNASQTNSRAIYFQYDANSQGLVKVTYPSGCTTNYTNLVFAAMGGTFVAPLKEVDAVGFATYFNYTSSTAPQILSNGVEPVGRKTYFSYPTSSIMSVSLVGRPGTYYVYEAISGGGTQVTRYLNPLGYATYFNYTAINDLLSEKIDPNGNATYFSYDVIDMVMTQYVSVFNGAMTYFKYEANHQDLQKVIGPRNVPGTFHVVTYYQYDGNRNLTTTTDALFNISSTIPDTLGRLRKRQDPRLNTTYYNYNTTSGLNSSIVDPLNQVTYFAYNSFADQTRVVSPRWRETGSYASFTSYYQFDNRDRLTKSIDTLGQSSYFSYTADGDLQVSVDPRKVTQYYLYNGLRLKTKALTSSNGVNTWLNYYVYDVYKNLSKQMDANANWSYYFYDAIDRQTVNRDALGNATYFFYDSVNNLTKQRDARANTNYFVYDLLSRKTSQRDSLGNVASFAFDLADNRTKTQDARLNTTYFTFDALNRITAVVDPLNGLVNTVYDPVGNLRVLRDQRQMSSYFNFDAINRVVSQVDAINNKINYGYDSASNRRKIQDPRQNTTYYIFDVLNRATSRVNALNGKSTKGYDPVNNVLKETDENLHATYFVYDSLSRIIQEINAVGAVTYFYYDAVGNKTKIRDQVVTNSYYFYDTVNRLSVERDGLAQSNYYFYDSVSNPIKRRNARANTTYYFWDPINRISSIRDALADVTYYGYDAVSNRVMIRDGMMHTNIFRYDPLNRITAMQDGAINSVYFGYDAVGNRLKQKDQRQNTSYFSYDSINRLSTVLDQLGHKSSYLYDQNSNLHATIDNLGQCNYFQYDALNRRTGISYGNDGYGIQAYGTTPYGGGTGENQTFTYDAVGNMLTTSAAASAVSYRYDGMNRITRKTSDSTSAYFSYVVRGDNQSFLRAIYYPNNVTAYYTYNNAQALSSVTSPAQKTTTYGRNPINNLTKTKFGNQTVCYYGYDNAERLIQIQHYTNTGQGIAYFNYKWDAANRLTKIVREMAAIYYSYDNADRLISETWLKKGTVTQIYGFQYNYDQVGNRTKCYRAGTGGEIDASYYVYDASNALTKRIVLPAGTLTYYTYDANGSVIKIYEGANATYFAYAPNQLVTQITPPASAGQPWQFAYDGQLSRRKIVKGAFGASYFLWNGMNQLEERNSAGTLTARYTHGEPVVPGVGSIVEVQRITATTTYFQYLHMDQQGSVAKVTDANQNIQISYIFDAFGRQIVVPTGANPLVPNDSKFQSNWITATIGTKQFGISPSRIYDFETGRFLQRDPLPVQVQQMRSSSGNTYGIYQTTQFTPILDAYASQNTGYGYQLFSLYFFVLPDNNTVDATGFACGCKGCEKCPPKPGPTPKPDPKPPYVPPKKKPPGPPGPGLCYDPKKPCRKSECLECCEKIEKNIETIGGCLPEVPNLPWYLKIPVAGLGAMEIIVHCEAHYVIGGPCKNDCNLCHEGGGGGASW